MGDTDCLLYGQFAAVVNEKKRKLREQQEHIQRLEEQLEGGPDQVNSLPSSATAEEGVNQVIVP